MSYIWDRDRIQEGPWPRTENICLVRSQLLKDHIMHWKVIIWRHRRYSTITKWALANGRFTYKHWSTSLAAAHQVWVLDCCLLTDFKCTNPSVSYTCSKLQTFEAYDYYSCRVQSMTAALKTMLDDIQYSAKCINYYHSTAQSECNLLCTHIHKS